jgi:hypothetical protein
VAATEMTGGQGKMKIDADVYLVLQEGKIKVDDAAVYIHAKGYMRARVTHIDIEDRIFGKIIHRGRGNMLEITGINGGIEIKPKSPRETDINGSKAMVYGIEARHPLLNEVLEVGESTVTWVGRKYDGIYIGFKEAQLRKLEQVAKKTFGVTPRKHLTRKKKRAQNC